MVGKVPLAALSFKKAISFRHNLCRLRYAQPNNLSPFIYSVDADGFKNWQKGGKKLFNHARSRFHKNAAENAKHVCTSQAVNVQINNSLKHLQNL